MKKFNLILIMLMVTICYSQQNSISSSLSERSLKIVNERINFVNIYVDSLNSYNISKSNKLPEFFYSHNFDRENAKYHIDMNDGTSFRKLIIDKIENIELLRAVLDCKDKRLKKKTKVSKKLVFGIMAFQEYSNYELVKYRLQELINESHMRVKATNYPAVD